MNREVASLYITILKLIAKKPAEYLTEDRVEKVRKNRCFDEDSTETPDFCQVLVNYITDAGRYTDDAIPVNFFTGRRSIVFKNSKISGRYLLRAIEKCYEDIESLDVSGCFQIDDDCVDIILRKCPRIVSLSIQNCRKLTDRSVMSFLEVKPLKILNLNVGGNFNIRNHSLSSFISSYPLAGQMKELHISGLPITDDILFLIANNFSEVERLSIGYGDISEVGISKLLRHVGSQLTYLNISWISSNPNSSILTVTPSFLVDSLSLQCPKLTELDITGIRNLNSSHICQLIEKKNSQALAHPKDWRPLVKLHAKFVATNKTQLESAVNSVYPYLELHA